MKTTSTFPFASAVAAALLSACANGQAARKKQNKSKRDLEINMSNPDSPQPSYPLTEFISRRQECRSRKRKLSKGTHHPD